MNEYDGDDGEAQALAREVQQYRKLKDIGEVAHLLYIGGVADTIAEELQGEDDGNTDDAPDEESGAECSEYQRNVKPINALTRLKASPTLDAEACAQLVHSTINGVAFKVHAHPLSSVAVAKLPVCISVPF